MAYSPELGTWIALAMLENGPARHGEVVKVADPLRKAEMLAEVVAPHFVDPDGERVRV
jgi:sarcosine oxidase subunit alpha